jgi:hypothetical protein
MRYLVILSFIAVLFTPYVFAEESFDGSSSIDPPITEVTPKKPTIMNVKFQYTSGPYAMNNFTPIIEISPERAGKFVQIDVEPIEIQKGQIRRIPVTLTVDPLIEHEKIFLSISFIGNHFQTSELYKSSWNESLTLDIAPRDVVGIALGDCELVNINYEISGGDVVTTCKGQNEISLKAIIDANSDGSVTFDIPTNIVYGLSSKDCKLDNAFFVLMNGKEVVSNIVGKKNSNLVTVEFTPGIHEIEVNGFTIIPNPSPAQYCGIVMDYDSQFLPPKQQTKRGVELRFIQCNDDYELLVKYNGTPSCVSPEHRSDFLKRGWSIPEKHTVFSKPNVDETMEIKIKEISKNSILSKGIGFDLPEDMFTHEDYQNLRQKENELKKIIATQNISMEEREKIVEEINSMQERLWYPFQTGVPYQLVQILKEKNEILMFDWVEFLETRVHITDTGDDISHEHQALIVGVHPDSFTSQQIEKLDKELREKMGNEMNILYKKSQGMVPSN